MNSYTARISPRHVLVIGAANCILNDSTANKITIIWLLAVALHINLDRDGGE